MAVASVIVQSLEPLARGRLGSYNDAFEPRAFGDTMQSWGTSTILVESGHWEEDFGKNTIRRLNFVGLLCAIRAIASGSYKKTGMAGYSKLVPNGKRAYDVITRGAQVIHGTYSVKADAGFQLEREKGTGALVARVREVGDLRGFGAIFNVSGRGVLLDTRALPVDSTLLLETLRITLRADLPGFQGSL